MNDSPNTNAVIFLTEVYSVTGRDASPRRPRTVGEASLPMTDLLNGNEFIAFVLGFVQIMFNNMLFHRRGDQI
jgi:hypothetical protein